MERDEIKALSARLKGLVEANKDFPGKLEKHLVSKSSKVENQFKFIVELFNEGVLRGGSNDVEMLVQLAVTIGCSKGADGIGGLVKALESSGNLQLLSALHTWAKGDRRTETDDDGGPSEPKEDTSALQFPPSKKLRRNQTRPTELSSSGAKLVEKIKEHVDEDGFMEQLEAFLISKASQIVQAKEFYASLLHQNVLVETVATRVAREKSRSGPQLATGSQVQERQKIGEAIKAACSKKDIKSLVLALQSSSNERILVEVFEWIESFQAKKKSNSIDGISLARQTKPTATGLFAATSKGLISLDLRTLEATDLTSENTLAVAVNNKLKKVYWSEGYPNYPIMRSNFDGSAKETVVPETGYTIFVLAIDEPSGNVYFALYNSQEITVCNALGQNRTAVISNSRLVNKPVAIALDSDNGVMYWGNRRTSQNSLVRANLDGSNTTMISTGFKDFRGLTLDQPSNGVLYWADCGANTIGSIDANGGNKRTIVKLEGNPGPYGIQVDAHKIYFSNFNRKNNIQSIDKGSGKELTTIFNSTGRVNHLAFFGVPA